MCLFSVKMLALTRRWPVPHIVLTCFALAVLSAVSVDSEPTHDDIPSADSECSPSLAHCEVCFTDPGNNACCLQPTFYETCRRQLEDLDIEDDKRAKFFLGRSLEPSSEDEYEGLAEEKRRSPFLGKRGRSPFLGKRRSPFLGKRRSPFLGKRADDDAAVFEEKRKSMPFLGK